MLGVVALRYWEEISVSVPEDTGSSNPCRKRAPLFDVAISIPKNVVSYIVPQTEEYQFRLLVPEPKASRIGEARQSSLFVEDMRVKPPLVLDLLKEATILIIQFDTGKRE